MHFDLDRSRPSLQELGTAQEKLNQLLLRDRDANKAEGQQRYMKSKLPFWGLSSPMLKAVVAEWKRDALPADPSGAYLRDLSLYLAEGADHREEVYVAMGVLDHSVLDGDVSKLPFIERLILLHPWWDVTDTLQRPLRKLLLDGEARDLTVSQISDWTFSEESFWLRREAIISQLLLKSQVDPDLLARTILPNKGNSEFFVAKAIGWALRDYARTDPDWVRRFVEGHELQPLSTREALKHIGA